MGVFVPIWLVLPKCEATNLGVFDLCHFALLKRGCANSVVGLELAEARHKLESPFANHKFTRLCLSLVGAFLFLIELLASRPEAFASSGAQGLI